MAHPVERETDQYLRALLRALRRIALVLVEMRDQFLLPGRTDRAARFRRCPAQARPSAALAGMFSELGVAVASAATDSVEAEVCTAAIFGSSSFGLLELFGVTTRSGSSVSVGVSFGSSVSLSSAFCSASAGEATEASVSGPGGRSVASRRGDINSSPISIAGAPRESSSSISRRCAIASAPPPT